MSDREKWLESENETVARTWRMIKKISRIDEPFELRPYHQVPGFLEYILPSSVEFLVINKFLIPQPELHMFIRWQSGDEK